MCATESKSEWSRQRWNANFLFGEPEYSGTDADRKCGPTGDLGYWPFSF